MLSSKIIILILSVYGLASTITYITYIVKYSNLKKTCNIKTSNSNDNLRRSDQNNNLVIKSQNNSNTFNNESNIIFPNNNLSNIISKYDIYYDTDFYNKYDLIDEYNDKIIIYSKDMIQCYKECENNNKCYGFSKYNNYCYLKSKYDLSQKNNASKITLVLNPSKE